MPKKKPERRVYSRPTKPVKEMTELAISYLKDKFHILKIISLAILQRYTAT